jgi:hypothetical protein
VSYPCEERKGGAPLLALIPCIVTIPVTASVLCSHPSQKRRRMGHPYRCRTSSRRPGPPLSQSGMECSVLPFFAHDAACG